MSARNRIDHHGGRDQELTIDNAAAHDVRTPDRHAGCPTGECR
jgi:hypothetical protein